MGIGYRELIWLFLIVLLLFGAKNLPRLAQSIGTSIREFKKGIQGLGDDLRDSVEAKQDDPAPKAEPKPVEHTEARDMQTPEKPKEA